MQLDAVLKTMAQAAAIEPPAKHSEAKPAAEPAPLEAAAIEPAPLEPAIEPTTVVTAPAIEPAIEQPVTVTEALPAAPAAEPAAIETITTVAAPAPAAMPAQAALADESITKDEEPLHTGSVPAALPASPDHALVSQPEVEVSIPAPVPSTEE